MESFYITLQSNQSLHYFPNNTSTDYTVKLGKTLVFAPNSVEIGLSQLYFTSEEKEKDENGNYIEFKPKFFGNVTGDNVMQVKGRSQSGFEFEKKNPDIVDFIKDFNEELGKRNYGVSFQLRVTEWGQVFVLNNTSEESVSFAMPQDLSHALGFVKSSFDYGSHEAEHEYSQSEYSKIEAGRFFEVDLFDTKAQPVIVEEPAEYTIPELMDAINKALKPFKCKLDFEVSVLKFTSNRNGQMVKLSPEMSQFLGIQLDQWFHTQGMSVDANPYLVLPTISTFMLITSSCADDQLFGSALLPILRIFPIPATHGNAVEYSFSPIQYVGLAGTEISQIRVQMIDDMFRPAPVAVQPSTVVLHLRHRSL
jgi:hypothetical protein